LFLAVNILDRYLGVAKVYHRHLQLFATIALWIAAKWEESRTSASPAPGVEALVQLCGGAYTREHFVKGEWGVLRLLRFEGFGYPTAETVLERDTRETPEAPLTMDIARYFMELTLLERCFREVTPSIIVASSLVLAKHITGSLTEVRYSVSFPMCNGFL